MNRMIVISNLNPSNTQPVIDMIRAYGFEYNEPDNYRITIKIDSKEWQNYRAFAADVVMNTSAAICTEPDVSEAPTLEELPKTRQWQVMDNAILPTTTYYTYCIETGLITYHQLNNPNQMFSNLTLQDLETLAKNGTLKELVQS